MTAQVMICGANDVEHLKTQASRWLRSMNFTPVERYFAPLNDSYTHNTSDSESKVRRSDLLIFIILDTYGPITWEHELRLATSLDLPVLMFLGGRTFHLYESLKARQIKPQDGSSMRELLLALDSFGESEHRRIVPFEGADFEVAFKEAMGAVLDQLLSDRRDSVELRRSKIALERDVGNLRQISEQRATAADVLLEKLHLSQNEARRISEERDASRELATSLRDRLESPRSLFWTFRYSRFAQYLIAGVFLILLVLGFGLGYSYGGNVAPSYVGTAVPTSPSVRSSAGPVIATAIVAPAVDVDPGLRCDQQGWVTYLGWYTKDSDYQKAQHRRSLLERSGVWPAVPLHLSRSNTMCSTGFALAYAGVPEQGFVLWVNPSSSQEAAMSLCEAIAGFDKSCFTQRNPKVVK